MARTSAQIIAAIRVFRPVNGDWLLLDTLLSELWSTGQPSLYIPDILAVLARFPEDDGHGVLWSIVHGLESLPGYEPDLIQSVQRAPSFMGVTMIGRLLNGGIAQVGGVWLLELLRTVAATLTLPVRVREAATVWVVRRG